MFWIFAIFLAVTAALLVSIPLMTRRGRDGGAEPTDAEPTDPDPDVTDPE